MPKRPTATLTTTSTATKISVAFVLTTAIVSLVLAGLAWLAKIWQ